MNGQHRTTDLNHGGVSGENTLRLDDLEEELRVERILNTLITDVLVAGQI